MNLWLRLFRVLLRSSLAAACEPLATSSLHLRVWPNDIDAFLHMNNGRYLTVMDLGRLDLLVRIGLWRVVLRRKWTPMIGSAAILFRRELRLFHGYRLETRIAGWLGRLAVIEQRFVIEHGARAGQIAAIGLVQAGLYDRARQAFVPVAEMMAALGMAAESPPLAPEVTAFLGTGEELLRALSGPAVPS